MWMDGSAAGSSDETGKPQRSNRFVTILSLVDTEHISFIPDTYIDVLQLHLSIFWVTLRVIIDRPMGIA